MNKIAQSKPIPKVGLDVIDNQHKLLLDLAKNFINAIGVGANLKILEALLSALLNYSFQHFQTEEKFFQNHADQKTHSLEHYSCIKRLTALNNDIRANKIKDSSIPSTFFEDWLFDHIERFDRPCLIHETIPLTKPSGSFSAGECALSFKEKRKHKRIPYHVVVDGEIVSQCYNTTNLNRGLARIVDMSPGGLKLHSTSVHKSEDMLHISCRIGRNFKMKENAKVITAHDHFYGVEFLSPTRETIVFLTELHGAIQLNRVKQAPGAGERQSMIAIP